MDLSRQQDRSQYLMDQILLGGRKFKDQLLTYLLKESELVNQKQNLSKSQFYNLLDKFDELRRGQQELTVENIYRYFRHQMERDTAQIGWAKEINGQPLGEMLREEFREFKERVAENPAAYLSEAPEAEQTIDQLGEDKADRFEFKLLERYLQEWMRIEIYGKEPELENAKKGEIVWLKI